MDTDWIAPLRTAGWALLRVAGWVLRLGHLLTVPLRYALYPVLRLLLFLLAPVRILLSAFAAAAAVAADLVARLKVRPTPRFLCSGPPATRLM